MIQMNRNLSTKKAQKILGWHSTFNNEQIILESVDTMVKYNLIHR